MKNFTMSIVCLGIILMSTLNSLAQFPPPQAPTNLSASNITTSSFTLHWDYGFILSQNHNFTAQIAADANFTTIIQSKSILSTGTQHSVVFDNLTQGTDYYARVSVRILGLPPVWSNHLLVTTGAPPVAPIALEAEDITENSFKARWSESGGQFPATEYELVVWFEGGTTTTYENITEDHFIVSATCGTKYYYYVKAINEYGSSPISSTIELFTPISKPNIVSVVSSTQTSALVTWNQITCLNVNYKLDVSTNSNFSSYVAGYENLNVGDVNSHLVECLDINTPYYFRVSASSTVENEHSEESDYKFITSTSSIPDKPGNVSDYGASTYINIWWNGGSGFCWPQNIEFEIKVWDIFGVLLSYVENIPSSTSYRQIHGFQPNNNYSYKIYAVNTVTGERSIPASGAVITCSSCRVIETEDDDKDNIESIQNTKLFPNPVKNLLKIAISNDDLINKIEIHDLSGKLMYKKAGLELRNLIHTLDLKLFEKGTYIVSGYSANKKVFTERIIKE